MSRVKNIAGAVVAVLTAAPVMLVSSTEGWAQGIEEIVVTTRRKSESLQEVPIAVTALGAETIDRQGIVNLSDVANLDPSVGFDTSYGPSDTRVAIRGLSNTRGRSNVAFLIDGIDVTTENVIAAGSGLLANQRLLGDVERIEIVKGPQSALYGRAAFAGALSYTTKEPSDVFEAGVRADVGEYGNQQYSGFVSTPMGETQGIRVDGVAWSADGYYQNETTGADVGGGQGYGASATYVWEPNDMFKIKARGSYSDDHYDVTPNYQVKATDFKPIPAAAYADVANGGAGLGGGIGFGDTSLVNWQPYCPDVIPVPPSGPDLPPGSTSIYPNAGGTPGFCLPESMGSYKGNEIRFDTSPSNINEDNEGTNQELARLTLNADWALEYGTINYTGGWTSAESSTQLDQDYQFDTANHQQGDYGTDTTQLSQEIRFSSSWEGPVQLTTGFLYWNERRRTEDKNFIIGCTRTTPLPNGTIDLNAGGGCDGLATNSPLPIGEGVTGLTISNQTDNFWRTLYNQYTPGIGPGTPEGAVITPTYWKAKTDHKSIYAAIDWDISEKWKLTLEDRYVDETFTLKKPNQSSCTLLAIGTGLGGGAISLAGAWQEGAATNTFSGQPYEQLCSFQNSGVPGNTWAYIEGSVDSSYHTPKVTLNWYAGDESMMYASVAKAQKPAGINQLSGGGSAETIESATFLPEQMTAYEIGTKSTWTAAGTLQINSALFFQDYTDKQISTQQLDDSGQLRPVISNAGGAEVWGLEFNATWLPDAVEGLTVSASYTFLNAKYTEWEVDVSSLYNVGRANQCQVVDDPTGSKKCRINYAGNGLERSPENALVTQLNYTRGLGNTSMEWFIEGNSSFTDERFVDAENSLSFDSYWLTNLRLGLIADKWDALVYVDNVFDDDTIKTGGSGPDFAEQVRELGFLAGFGVNHYFATAPDPRVVGVRANYRFGGGN